MLTWLKELDRILRGEATRPDALRRGAVEVLEQELAVGMLILSMLHGACMGCYALASPEGPEFRQLLASMLKVPALFFLTLVVTFPSLYVFNTLVGCRLTLLPMLRLLVAALSVLIAVLASLGPIVAFFSITSANYSFVLLLNVAVFAVAGVLGLGFLLQTLHRLSVLGLAAEYRPPEPAPVPVAELPQVQPVSPEGDPAAPAPPPEEVPRRPPPPPLGTLPLEQLVTRRVRTVFYAWVLVFVLVCAQMAWVLRPFVGDPRQSFVLFRHRETSHVFQGVWRAVYSLFSETEHEHVPDAGRSRPALPHNGGN